MKTFRKCLALFLSLALFVTCVQIPSIAEAYDEATDIVMQAETDAMTNMYSVSGDVLGNLGSVDWDAVKACDFSDGQKINKSVLPYVAYNVKAPAAGDYEIKVGWAGKVAAITDYAMNIKVNDGTVYTMQDPDYATEGGHETAVTVHLEAGNNVIYCIPYDAANIEKQIDTWINYDYLAFASSTGLEAVSPSALELKPSYASFVNLFNKKESDGSLGGRNGAEETMLADELTDPAKLAQVAYFSYTVSVPNDGYYDISMKYNTDGEKAGCFGFLVDGSLNKLPVNWCGDRKIADASVYLTAGTHTLTCTARTKELETDAWSWSDLLSFTIYGGAVRSDYQIDPVGGMSRMETELDATEIPTDLYHNLNAQDGGCSGYGQVGDCYGFSTDNFQTEAELKDSLDKRVPYMQYTIIAPADGQYDLKPVYYVSMGSAAYTGATVKVNDDGVYFAAYGSKDSGFADTAVTVTLKKGRNVVTVLPYNATQKDQAYQGWINQDYLGIDSRLTGVKDTSAAVDAFAGNAAYYGNYSTANADGGLYDNNSTDSMRMLATAEGATLENIEKYPWYSITVTAPQNGYYELTEKLDGASSNFNYFACLVNGTNYIGKKTDNEVRFYPYLQAGDNELCFTGQVPRDKADWEAYIAGSDYYTKILNNPGQVWTNILKVTLSGGVKLAADQKDPRHSYQTIQAEDTTKTFINESRYSVQSDGVGGGNFSDAQDVAGLTEYLDKEKTPYVAVVVDAPAAGDYAVGANVVKSIPNMDDKYKNDGTLPMVTFKVNDGAPVQAAFSGTSGGASLTNALVSLEAGRNVIYCMPVTQEERTHIATYDSSISNHWANVDYINVDSALTVVNVESVTLNAADSEFVNLYKKDGGSLNGADYSPMEAEEMNITDLTRRSIAKVPYFSYTVTAPTDGYYDITVKGSFGGTSYNTYGLMADTAAYAKKATSGYANFSIYLTKGDHPLVFTAVMPQDGSGTYTRGTYTDFDNVTFHGGLQKASAQKNPGIHFAPDPMEAEKDAVVSAYVDKNLEVAGASGTVVGKATGIKMTASEMNSLGPVYGVNSYVAYAVYAPVADNYDLAVCMQMGNAGNDDAAYQEYKASHAALTARIFVNSTEYEAAFPDASSMGDRVQVSWPEVPLNQGINLIYCMDIDADTAKLLDGAYVNYDCLLIQDELDSVDPKNLIIPGDANANLDVSVADLVHAKKKLVNGSGINRLVAVDFNSSGAFEEEDLTSLRNLLIGNPGANANAKWLRSTVVDKGVTAYSTVIQYSNTNKYLDATVSDSTATLSVVEKGNASQDSSVNVVVDTSTTYQTFDGFGAAMTDSSAINLYQLDEDSRNDVMNALFSADGLGFTFLRQPLGASDFVQDLYTYCDTEGPEGNKLQYFSIAHDEQQIIPLIQQVKSIIEASGNTLHVYATPWTAPLWMKEQYDWDTLDDAGNATYNRLKWGNEQLYAEYLTKAVQAYQNHGITIEAMSLQNELDACHPIPSMFEDKWQMEVIAPAVKNALQNAGLNTKLFAYEFNWFGSAEQGQTAEQGAQRVEEFMQGIDYDGIAFHPYTGDSQVQQILYDKYGSTKKIYVTEAAGSTSDRHFFNQMKMATESLNTGASTYIGWNIMLDENRGPATINPNGIGLTQRNNDGTWTKTSDYYAFAQLSKFIKPGAQIVKSTVSGNTSNVCCTAARNIDGSVAVVVSNGNCTPEMVSVTVGDKVIEQKVPANSAVTYVVNDGVVRMEAEDQGSNIHNYGNHQADIGVGKGVGGATGGINATFSGLQQQTDSSIESYLSGDSYVAYKITAPETGYYPVKVRYQMDGSGFTTEIRKEHSILLYANGTAYKAAFQSDGAEGMYDTTSISTVYVKLNKGQNTLYSIPFDNEYYNKYPSAWINQDYLEVDLHAVGRVEAEGSISHNYASTGGPMVGGAYGGVNVTFDNLQQQTDATIESYLSEDSYVAYNVTVPETGYYPVKVRYQMDGSGFSLETRNEHSILLYANGTAYKAAFRSDGAEGTYDTTSISTAYMKLNKGQNTVYSIPFDQEYKNTYPSAWLDQDYLEVDLHGVVRVEAEGSNIHKYSSTGGSMVGGAYGGVNVTFDNLQKQTDATIAQYLSNDSYVAYNITVPQAGYYPVKVRYQMDGSDFSLETRNEHSILLYANGMAYKALFRSDGAEGMYDTTSISTVYVKLNKGQNTVYSIPFDQEYKNKYPSAWLDQDYLEVDLQANGI